MLKRDQLPPDNYPDDFESSKYHNYKPTLRPGLRLWVRESGTQVFFAVFFPFLLVCSVATAFILNLEDRPTERIVIVTTATAVPATIGGDFPITGDQQQIDIPAKIDNVIVGGTQHSYRFMMRSNITWSIEVYSTEFDPVVTLYDSQGIVVATDDANNTITYQPSAEGEFGLLIDASITGTYTLSILPVR